MKTALSIAGSDCSGGAGIQADLKTMAMNGVYGMSAITALTAQNTTGVRGIYEVSPQFLEEQLDAVFEDIFPDAVKIGMVASAGLVEATMPIFTASGKMSSNTASSCSSKNSGLTSKIPCTPVVFWAVSAVIALMP